LNHPSRRLRGGWSSAPASAPPTSWSSRHDTRARPVMATDKLERDEKRTTMGMEKECVHSTYPRGPPTTWHCSRVAVSPPRRPPELIGDMGELAVGRRQIRRGSAQVALQLRHPSFERH
jgi:hypothetical protein